MPSSHPVIAPLTLLKPSRARRFLETTGLLLSLMLICRAVGVEPYGVPTGSMAPALVGNHKAAICPRCGYPVLVGQREDRREYGISFCQNCGHENLSLVNASVCRGDQLLVNKCIFDWRQPRRWEMAVFRCPTDPDKAFVKRVVGLPGESVRIHDGDIYIDHALARKSLAEFKALRIPVFDNNYQPNVQGWDCRWQTQPAGESAHWEAKALRLDADPDSDEYQWLVYRHWLLDEDKSEPIRDEYSYNGGDVERSRQPVHDFMLECDLNVLQGDGWVALGITDGGDHLVAELPVGALKEGTQLRSGIIHRTAPSHGLVAGKTYHIEFAFVDRRATLAVDGGCPFQPVDFESVAGRQPVERPARIGVRGVAVRIENFRLFRDIHYLETGEHGVHAPVQLRAGEYFVLGDNTPNSDDNRFWSGPDGKPMPVAESSFLGKPFLIHLPSRWTSWQAFGGQGQYQGCDWSRVRWVR